MHRPALLLHGYGMATDAFEHHELFQGPARHRRLHMQCCLCVWGGGGGGYEVAFVGIDAMHMQCSDVYVVVWGGGRGRGGGGKKVVLFVTNCVE